MLEHDSYLMLIEILVIMKLISKIPIEIKIYTASSRLKRLISDSIILKCYKTHSYFLDTLINGCEDGNRLEEYTSIIDTETIHSFCIVKNIASEK